MTTSEINRAIAELCGWVHLPRFDGDAGGYWLRGGERVISEEMPDYHSDLNACSEMERTLASKLIRGFRAQGIYENMLVSVVGGRTIYHATAPQRCEAFLRTHGKWVDDQPNPKTP